MTSRINGVSDREILELARAFHDGPLMADDHEFVTDSGQGQWCLEVAKFFATELAARRAANTPVGPELWGKYPDTGVWHQIADGTNTDEQVADFERCYAEAGWTELRRSNPFASPALPSQVVDDEDLASDERWNEGVNYAIKQLCELLGIDWRAINWDAATETLDGDVRSVIGNAMVAAYGEEWSSDAETTARIQACLTSPAAEPVSACDGQLCYYHGCQGLAGCVQGKPLPEREG